MPLTISLDHLAEHNRQCGEQLRLSEDHLNLLYGIMGTAETAQDSLSLEQLVSPPLKQMDIKRATLQSLLRLLHTVPESQHGQATRLVFLTYHHLMLDLLVFVSHSAITPTNFRALNRAAYALRDKRDAAKAHEAFSAAVFNEGRNLVIGAQHDRELRDLANSIVRSFETMANAMTYKDRAAALAHLCSLAAVVEVFRLYYFAGAQMKLQPKTTLTMEEIINRADDFGLPRIARFFDMALADMREDAP